MSVQTIHFRTDPARVSEVEDAITKLFATVEVAAPADIEYTAARVGDGAEFLLTLALPDDAANPLLEIPQPGRSATAWPSGRVARCRRRRFTTSGGTPRERRRFDGAADREGRVRRRQRLHRRRRPGTGQVRTRELGRGRITARGPALPRRRHGSRRSQPRRRPRGFPTLGLAAAVGLSLFYLCAIGAHVRASVFHNIAFPVLFLVLAFAAVAYFAVV